jgi:hypothetical protein
MANMQNVKTAIGKNHVFAGAAQASQPVGQCRRVHYF